MLLCLLLSLFMTDLSSTAFRQLHAEVAETIYKQQARAAHIHVFLEEAEVEPQFSLQKCSCQAA